MIRKLKVEEVNQLIEDNLVKIKGSSSHCSHITETEDSHPCAPQQPSLQQFKDIRYMFFAYRKLGNVVHLLFKVDNIKKLVDGQAVLSGEVTFGNEQLNGDITIDLVKNKVFYKHKKDRCKYDLEPD